MRIPREFKVNEYMVLRQENRKTFIYVDGKRFRQCRTFMTDIIISDINKYNKCESIDELDLSLRIDQYKPENCDFIVRGEECEAVSRFKRLKLGFATSFWSHCSTLQAWDEHNYDTRLLHSNLAFPLLKKLTEIGDLKARRVFKEEIAKRFSTGFKTVVHYLIKEKYLQYFDSDEINMLARNCQFKEIDLSDCELNVIPEWVFRIKTLEKLILSRNKLIEIPESISELSSLKILILAGNHLSSLPDSLIKLHEIRTISLDGNDFRTNPQILTKIKSLREISITQNLLT